MAYSEGKIYLIYIPGLEECGYVGSTIQTLAERLKAHKYSAKSDTKYKFASCALFEVEENHPEIKCIEEFPCETREQLLERESYWLSQYPDAVNKNTPHLTAEERHERAKACLLKCYYAKRDERIEKMKKWKADNPEKVAEYLAGRKDINREQEKARYAAGYKEKRAEAKKEKVECPACKKVMNRNSLWEHKKKLHPE